MKTHVSSLFLRASRILIVSLGTLKSANTALYTLYTYTLSVYTHIVHVKPRVCTCVKRPGNKI